MGATPSNMKWLVIVIIAAALLTGGGLALDNAVLADDAASSGDTPPRRPPPSATTTDAAFLEWARRQGIEAHATLEERGGVRGTYALRRLAPGDVIAKIPLATAALWLGPPETANTRAFAARLLRAAADPSDARAPWFAALPMLARARGRGGRSSIDGIKSDSHRQQQLPAVADLQLHAETFPPEYLHLLASPAHARRVADTQSDTSAYWAARGMELAREGFDIEDLRAAAVTVATRYMSVPHRGKSWPILVPLLDMANHRDDCANWYEFRGCADPLPDWPRGEAAWREAAEGGAGDTRERGELCAFWFAGAPVDAGGEACLSYGYVAPDVALLQYGFLPPEPTPGGPPPPLALMDRPGYAQSLLVSGGHTHAEPPGEFDGDAAALAAEVKRVSALADLLSSTQPTARATRAALPRDASGEWLAQILALRERRVAGLRGEQARLQRRIAESEAAEGEEGAAGETASSSDGSRRDLHVPSSRREEAGEL